MANLSCEHEKNGNLAEFIKASGERLAGLYDLDISRLSDVLKSLSNIGWMHYREPDSEFPYSTPLDVALRYADPTVVLRVFENEDLDLLHRKVDLLDDLRDKFSPFYSLTRLKLLALDLIGHLRSNSEHLLQTGYPQTAFAASPWLDFHLTRCYPVKLPFHDPLKNFKSAGLASPLSSRYLSEIKDRNSYSSYIWIKEPSILEIYGPSIPFLENPDLAAGVEKKALLRRRWPVTVCSYQEAALIPELDPDAAKMLNEIRPKILELKMKVLEVLSSKDMPSVEDLKSRWKMIMIDSLLAEEASFLLKMDEVLGRAMILGDLTNSVEQPLNIPTAGLTDLLQVIGHFECEHALGTMHATYGKLQTFIPTDCLSSYFQSLGRKWRGELDSALADCLDLRWKAKAYWESFAKDVITFSRTKLKTKITRTEIIPAERAELIRRAHEAFSRCLNALLNGEPLNKKQIREYSEKNIPNLEIRQKMIEMMDYFRIGILSQKGSKLGGDATRQMKKAEKETFPWMEKAEEIRREHGRYIPDTEVARIIKKRFKKQMGREYSERTIRAKIRKTR